MPCFIHGSLFNFSRTSPSSSALTISIEPPSSTNGPPINTKPSTTSSSMNTACSSQSGCSRVLFDGSRFGPAEEIATNVFFIARYDGIYCPQINADLRDSVGLALPCQPLPPSPACRGPPALPGDLRGSTATVRRRELLQPSRFGDHQVSRSAA